MRERVGGSGIVLHIPHSSRSIPDHVRLHIELDDAQLDAELTAMTDAHTDELFGGDCGELPAVIFPISRLVVDPERFEDDAEERMADAGMGVIYEKTSRGARLRARPHAEERAALVEGFYRPHHEQLRALVASVIDQVGHCLVLDGHSFPSVPLAYEPDQRRDRPDICIGTDTFHTPAPLEAAALAAVHSLGWTVDVNRPFAGALVPMPFYGTDKRVQAVMIEINRGLYMDETTGEQLACFDEVAGKVRSLVAALASYSADLTRTA
jgi:N-formylglutamate amidohydrolase